MTRDDSPGKENFSSCDIYFAHVNNQRQRGEFPFFFSILSCFQLKVKKEKNEIRRKRKKINLKIKKVRFIFKQACHHRCTPSHFPLNVLS